MTRAKRQPSTIVTLPRIPIAAIGTWQCLTGEAEFTPEMMESAIAASLDPGIGPPRIRRGHFAKMSDPLIGLAVNLHLDDDGMLYSDWAGIDADEAEALPFRYPDRSIEGDFDVTSPVTGKTYPFAIRYVAALPVDGAVTSLPDLPFDAPVPAIAAALHLPAIAAAWSPDAVRRAWSQQHGDTPSIGGDWSYVEEIEVDPNAVIVAGGAEGTPARRIPFDLNADGTFTFRISDAVPVRHAWIPVTPVAASAPTGRSVARYQRSDLRPEPHERKASIMDPKMLRASLGLQEDATDEQVAAALAEAGITIPVASDNDPGGKDGDPSTPKTDEIANPDPSAPRAPGSEQPHVPDGMALVPQEFVDQAREVFGTVETLTAERAEQDADAYLHEHAVMAGRMTPRVARETWRPKLIADPDGTRKLIESIPRGIVPVDGERGIMAAHASAAAVDGRTDDDAATDAVAEMLGVPNLYARREG